MKKIKHLADFGKPLTREEMKNVKAGFSQAACTGYCKGTQGICYKSSGNIIECTYTYDSSAGCGWKWL